MLLKAHQIQGAPANDGRFPSPSHSSVQPGTRGVGRRPGERRVTRGSSEPQCLPLHVQGAELRVGWPWDAGRLGMRRLVAAPFELQVGEAGHHGRDSSPAWCLAFLLLGTTTEDHSVTSDAGEGSGCGLSSAPPMRRRTVVQPMVAGALENDAGP